MWGFGTQEDSGLNRLFPLWEVSLSSLQVSYAGGGRRPGAGPVYKAPAFTLPAQEEPDRAQFILDLVLQGLKQALPPVGLKWASVSCDHLYGHPGP